MEDKNLMTVQSSTNSLQAYVNDINQKLAFCDMLLKSNMMPSHLKTPQAVLSSILYGQELGLTPLQATNSVIVIQGKVTLDSHGIRALMLQNGAIIRTKNWDASECVLEVTRGNWTEVFEFTIENAKSAGLLGKDNWKAYPKDCLYARCITRAGKNMFGDVLKGIAGREEMEDVQVLPADPKPTTKKKETPINTIESVMNTEYLFSYNFGGIPSGDFKKHVKELLKKANGKPDETNKDKIWTTRIIPELEEFIIDFPEPQNLDGAIIPDNAEVQHA